MDARLMGAGMACGGLPGLQVVLHRMLAIIILYEMINVWDTVSAFVHLLKTFLFEDFLCKQWIEHVIINLSFISDANTEQRTITRSVPGWAIDSLQGVWCCGWTTCLLYGHPLLGFKWQLVCKFGIVLRNFYQFFAWICVFVYML